MDNRQFQLQAQALATQAKKDPATNWTEKYLGKKGLFNQLAGEIKNIVDKKQAGITLNQLKKELETLQAQQQATHQKELLDFDYTLPAAALPQGHLHPISLTIERISEIFARLGFVLVRHPEVDTDEYAFGKLNMAPGHPARDEWETFFVSHPHSSKASATQPRLVLTPHTSNGQPHEIDRLKTPPIRMINISRCYRRQQDVTHTQMFHQFEGMVVDSDINITHLKGVLDFFAKEFFGPESKSRIRPFHFQFTEPSFEVDFSCHFCQGKGTLKDGSKCRFCKSGWHEVGGAGMIHPHVLQASGLDSSKYTGFAFGWGIERATALQKDYGLDDIRNFYNGNLDFLSQF